jgi:hypothetical protein
LINQTNQFTATWAWKSYYEMGERQVSLLKSIYIRISESPKGGFSLSDEAVDMIGITDEKYLQLSKESFAEIGIIWS